jgi:hypothetical protein
MQARLGWRQHTFSNSCGLVIAESNFRDTQDYPAFIEAMRFDINGASHIRPGEHNTLHSSRLYRRALDFAHVPVVYGGQLTIVPRDRD